MVQQSIPPPHTHAVAGSVTIYTKTTVHCSPLFLHGQDQGVTKKSHLSWLTNSALVYEPKYRERRGEGGLRDVSQRIQLYTGAQINFGDLTPNLTYGQDTSSNGGEVWRRAGGSRSG